MDLSDIKPATQKVDIRHPATGTETGLVIEVTSNESDAVKAVQRRHLDKALRNRNKTAKASDIEAERLDRTIAAIVGWEWQGDASWGGKKLPFNKDNLASVLEAGWVRSQVEEAINDEQGFFSN